jgi:altronate dehydratase large subunit
MLQKLCTHPNVGAALLVSLGCEGMDKRRLQRAVADSGRPVALLGIQDSGGTARTVAAGRAWIESTLPALQAAQRAPMRIDELTIGTICGGSDATSGLSANPAMGHAFDLLLAEGAKAIFEETGELIGMEELTAARAARAELGPELKASVAKAARYYATLGYASFTPGNADGGLTTIEEKSLGAYAKSGQWPISGIVKPGIEPPAAGLYLLDVVPDGEVRFGFPNINDNAEIAELISCGAQIILFSTGRGSVVGSAIAPVIKVCANPQTFKRMGEDMDVDAGASSKAAPPCPKSAPRSASWCFAWATASAARPSNSGTASSSSPTRASGRSGRPAWRAERAGAGGVIRPNRSAPSSAVPGNPLRRSGVYCRIEPRVWVPI